MKRTMFCSHKEVVLSSISWKRLFEPTGTSVCSFSTAERTDAQSSIIFNHRLMNHNWKNGLVRIILGLQNSVQMALVKTRIIAALIILMTFSMCVSFSSLQSVRICVLIRLCFHSIFRVLVIGTAAQNEASFPKGPFENWQCGLSQPADGSADGSFSHFWLFERPFGQGSMVTATPTPLRPDVMWVTSIQVSSFGS